MKDVKVLEECTFKPDISGRRGRREESKEDRTTFYNKTTSVCKAAQRVCWKIVVDGFQEVGKGHFGN